MNDLIINGDALAKRITLTRAVNLILPGGTATIPVGTVIEGIMEYRDPALDNNPTPNNKANLLSDDAENKVWHSNPPVTPTVSTALSKLADDMQALPMSTFELIQRGLI